MRAVLLSFGFKKQGNTYARSVGDVVHLINLQSSRTSSAAILHCTINLGVVVPRLESPWLKADIGRTHWSERLGHLAGQNDRWWTATSSGDAEAAGDEITTLLETVGLRALDDLSSSDALCRLWETGVGPGLTDTQRRRYRDELKKIVRPS